VFPVGVPLLFAYLLLVRFRGTLEKQCDKEQLASETKKAAKHVDRLHERREEERKSTASQQQAGQRTLSRRLSVGRAVVAKLQQTDLARMSYVSEAGTEGEVFGTTAVWKETATVLDELQATYLGFLLNPYVLRCFWFEVFECARKVALVGVPVFFVNKSLEQLMVGLVVCFISQSVFTWFKPYRALIEPRLATRRATRELMRNEPRCERSRRATSLALCRRPIGPHASDAMPDGNLLRAPLKDHPRSPRHD
jgi:hypothetical protein